MYGFNKPAAQPAGKTSSRRGAAQQSEDSGEIRGPGSGTSDSIKTAVPAGSYIMPADSTQAIGPDNLAGMGFKPGQRQAAEQAGALSLGFKPGAKAAPAPTTDAPGMGFKPGSVQVNLSDGEFKLSPEQVHAIGAQVLEGMKAATHTPAAQQEREEPGEPAEPEKFRTELFFADGGVVEGKRDPFAYQAPQAAAPATQPSPIPGAERSNLPTFKPDTSAPSPIKGPLDSMGAAYGGTAAKLTFGAFDSRADDILAQNREGLIAEPAKAPPPSPKPVQSPTTPATAAAPPATTATPAPAPTGMPGVETSVPSVRRIDAPGKAPLFTNVGPDAAGFRPGMDSPAVSGGGAGFTSPDVLGILQRENQIRAGMAPLMDQIRFNEGTRGNGNYFGFRRPSGDEGGPAVLRDPSTEGQAERERSAVMQAAMTPLRGSPNGQLTANQLRTAQGLVDGSQRDATARYQADTSAATQRDTAAIREEGEAARSFEREQGANQRARASNQIQQQEMGLRREAQGFQTREAQRKESLQARYEAAKTPEERSAIAQQIRDLSGKQEPANRFTVVPGGQGFNNDGTPYTLPARVLNNQTGQFVDQRPAAPQAQALPSDKAQLAAGQVYQTARGPARWDGKQFVGV